jgi:hypothetical protein
MKPRRTPLTRLLHAHHARGLAVCLSIAALINGGQQTLDVRYNPFKPPGYFALRPENAAATYANRRWPVFKLGDVHLTSSHSLPRQVLDPNARLYAAVEMSAPDRNGTERDYCIVVSAQGWALPQAHLAHSLDWTVVELTRARCERRRTGIQSGA